MRILLIVVGVWLAWAALAFVLQRRFLYPGAYMAPRDHRGPEPPGMERLWIEHRDGRAEAWFVPTTASDPAPALVWFHGNGEFIDDWLDVLRPFPEELGIHLLLVEYPGYGRSTGSPSRTAVMEVATKAWDGLVERPEVDGPRMVAMGRSLGGGPAAELGRVRRPAAVILQSTFTDVGVMAARHSFVPPFLIRDRWQPLEAVRAFDAPVLVIHGRRDRIVPVRHGEALGSARPGVRLELLECGHNDCPPPGEAWWATVRSFLAEAGVMESGR